MKLYAVLVLLSIFLIGCGSKTEDSYSGSIKMGPTEKLSVYTKRIMIDDSAPDGVGTVLSMNDGMGVDRDAAVCTGFAISKTRVMTNSHCIPEKLKKDKSLNCSEYLQGRIKQNNGYGFFTCKKVLFFSDISKLTIENNDYALFEVEEPFELSTFLQLNRKGVSEGEKLDVHTLNHDSNSSRIFSAYKRHHCTVKSSDLFGNITSPGVSPLAGFKEENSQDYCKTIEGNSGSPVTNGDGQLVAILHGGLKEGSELLPQSDDSISSVTNDVAIMTNLRCQKLSDAKLDADVPSECAQEKRVTGLNREKVLGAYRAKLSKGLDDVTAKQPSYFEYDVNQRQLGSDTMVSFYPKCMKPMGQWKEEDLKQIDQGGLLSRSKSIKTTLQQYRVNFKVIVNYYGNYELNFDFKKVSQSLFETKGLDDLEPKGQVNSNIDMSAVNAKNGINIKIPLCKPAH